MWRILQQDKAEDFVLATGETHTVKEFVELTFKEIGIEIEWKGKGVEEKGVISGINFNKGKQLLEKDDKEYRFGFSDKLKLGDVVVVVNPDYYRPTEVDLLIGDPTKAEKILGWKAQTRFEDLVHVMIKADLDKVLRKGY